MTDVFFDSVVKDHITKTYHYFDGETWRDSHDEKTITITSPIDGQIVGQVPAVSSEEIDTVISRAKQAQTHWEHFPFHERVLVIHKAASLLREHHEFFVDTLIAEIGKTREESKKEIIRTADMIDYFAREAQTLTGQSISSDLFPGFDSSKLALVERTAHGVVIAIGPFNYPINLTASKIAPALLMGNAVVFKPPTQGSIVGLYLTQVFIAAGVPKNVMSCITGAGREIGNHVVSHPEVSMVAFTGSSSVGQTIAEKTGMIPLLFECGGNNPAIVLPDADITETAQEIVVGGFSYAGQRCTGLKYVLAEQGVLEKLIPEVVKKTQELVHMGDPNHSETKLVGPVISEAAAKEIEAVIAEAISQGAEMVIGGKRNGTYIEPTILKHVTHSMKVVAEETFGPVICFLTVGSVDEAIQIINSSSFGLQTSIFSQDEGTAIVLSRRISTGTVQINGSPQRGPDHFPFMGIRKSGVGVQGVRYSLEAMSRLKSVVINKLK